MFFFTGFLIGVVSLIPGISGGTILVLTKQYANVSNAIAHFKENRRQLLTLVLGIFIGAITFARIIELLFYFAPKATLIVFSGFILFSIPSLMKQEIKKPNWFWFFFGACLLFFLSNFSMETPPVILEYPKLSLPFLFLFGCCGALDGFFTILPGISGSMMMMILGPYFLYKSYLAHLSFSTIVFLIPLLFYFLGDLLGFYIGSKVSLYFLKKQHKNFMSFILGMVLMSALVLLPLYPLDGQHILLYGLLLTLSFLLKSLLQALE